MKLRYKIGLIVLVLGSVFALGRCGGRSTGPKAILSTVLPPNDIEQILVDPVKHTLIIRKPIGNQTLTLPDHVSTIDIRKDGTVKVTSPQYGFEHRPFFGVQGSNAFRLAAGLDVGYFKKLDLGIGVADAIGGHLPIAFGQVSYNFYDNCRIGVTYGTDRLVGGSITIRL